MIAVFGMSGRHLPHLVFWHKPLFAKGCTIARAETDPAMTDAHSEPLPPVLPPMPADHPVVQGKKTAVLLINLGTPSGTSYGPMRRYLSEFLSDKRVIEYPSWLWQPLLQGIILSVRPSKSGKAYQSIWREDTDESPLRYFTRRQGELLGQRLAGDGVVVDWGMRYGEPSIKSRIDALMAMGCERIVLMPLYPQYSASTTATANDQAFRALMSMRHAPAVRTLPPHHDDPAYIHALATSLQKQVSALDFEPQQVILSFHGLPKSYFMKGDPYHCHCAKTARLVTEKLAWPEGMIRLTFQSRFGPAEWLQPYTDKTLEALPAQGITRVAVATPGFISDCVETLEEIAIEGAEEFREAGGTHFAALPCLNDSVEAIDLLETLARRELSGWIPSSTD